jgi:L-serine deaminase
MNRQNLGLVKLLWRNETVLSGLDATLLKAGLDKILDAVVEAMLETGRDMSERYK